MHHTMRAAMSVGAAMSPVSVTRTATRAGTLVHKYVKTLKVAASLPLYRLQRDKRAYARWLRGELEDAGCLFIKIGQWVASRGDIFPVDVIEAFGTLLKDVTPMVPKEVGRILREEGWSPDVFDHLEQHPMSCGSVAQVHRGVYRGQEVAVKVQRPGLQDELREDLGIVRNMLVALRLQGKKTYDDALKSLDDLGATILRETDFVAEGDNMRVFETFFAGSPEGVRVPKVVAATPRVVVMEYVPSTDVCKAPAETTQRLMDLFLTQVFELGYVHTDLHAGNVGVDDRGNLVLYDFGSVLECPEGMRQCIKRMFVSYLNRNPAVMLDYLVEFDVLRGKAPLTPDQRKTLETFVSTIVEYVEKSDIREFGQAVRGIPVPATLPDVEFQPEVFMLFRSFTLLEGLCKDIDPRFTILDAMIPFVTGMLLDPDMYRIKVEDDVRNAMSMLSSS